MQAKQYEKERFEREREELLHTKFTTNANAANGASDTSILIGKTKNAVKKSSIFPQIFRLEFSVKIEFLGLNFRQN